MERVCEGFVRDDNRPADRTARAEVVQDSASRSQLVKRRQAVVRDFVSSYLAARWAPGREAARERRRQRFMARFHETRGTHLVKAGHRDFR